MQQTPLYTYVGAEEIKNSLDLSLTGFSIHKLQDIEGWIKATNQELRHGSVTATYVVNEKGELLLSDRHSEHVMCAGGNKVLAAGEITFEVEKHEISVSGITNQSTGYCPRPACWQSVNAALKLININYPAYFTQAYEFRYCTHCTNINLIKEQIFECVVCGANLDLEWNLDKKK